VPIDLLFVMIAIPTLIHYFDPKQLLENFIVQWAGWLCHQLRLSSFLLDKRPMNEEGHYKTWKAWIQRPELNGDADGGTFVKSGQLVRAPKHDSVKYVPGRRMLVPVDPVTFEPIEKLERELGHPAGEDTTIIYLPPHFKLRMALFMAIMWAFWCILICCLFVCPIVLGRWVLVYLDIQIQDVYAYLLGGIILIFIGVLIKLASVNSFQLSWVSYSETITRS
jgi:E3 ubiquitin-protein ligase MARCH6